MRCSIAADVGGTKTRLILRGAVEPYDWLYEAEYRSADFTGLLPLLEYFLNEAGADETTAITALELALPGVVDTDRVQLTNLPWSIERRELSDRFATDSVYFINDFQASALGTIDIDDSACITLHQGDHSKDHALEEGEIRVVAGAGTGLGVAWLQHCDGKDIAHATEGGHIDFAANDDEQISLYASLARDLGHVSYERLLSGSGIETLYHHYSGEHKDAAGVSRSASEGDASAIAAIRQFVAIYGAFVGNLALLFKPDSIYITGGIAAKLQEQMTSSDFTDAYLEKGRMRKITERTTVRLVLDERIGAIGAARDMISRLRES